MASGATHSDPTPPPVQAPVAAAAARQPSRYEQFIGSEIDRTGRQVKTVDIGVSILALAAGMLCYLFVVALVDHWLVPLSTLGRWLAFVLLAAGSLWWIAVP